MKHKCVKILALGGRKGATSVHVDEHAKRSLKKYGYEARHVHEWLDHYWPAFNDVWHRDVRHNAEGIEYIADEWGYLAKLIAIQHIEDDCHCVPMYLHYHCDKYGADDSIRNLVTMLYERTYA